MAAIAQLYVASWEFSASNGEPKRWMLVTRALFTHAHFENVIKQYTGRRILVFLIVQLTAHDMLATCCRKSLRHCGQTAKTADVGGMTAIPCCPYRIKRWKNLAANHPAWLVKKPCKYQMIWWTMAGHHASYLIVWCKNESKPEMIVVSQCYWTAAVNMQISYYQSPHRLSAMTATDPLITATSILYSMKQAGSLRNLKRVTF